MTFRQLPALDADNRAFWTRGATGVLAICRCTACRTWIHPPLPVCPDCGADAAPEAVSGRGSVHTFTVNHQPWVTGQTVPYVLAVIELAEQRGLWVTSTVVGCAPESVVIDLAVEVCFEQHEEVWLPVFRPAAPVAAGQGA